jgi:hypothetical protein
MPIKPDAKPVSGRVRNSNITRSKNRRLRYNEKSISYDRIYSPIVIDGCDYVIKESSGVVKTDSYGIVVGRMVDGDFDDTYCGNSDGEYE